MSYGPVASPEKILASFPKQRRPLPRAYQEIYHEHYVTNRGGQDLLGRVAHILERWMHIQVAADVRHWRPSFSTLEIGAGTLNHLPYEPSLPVYDVVEPYQALYAESPFISRIRQFYSDIRHVNRKYDRILAVAVFEHLSDLPEVIARCGLLLNRGGVLRVAIPTEGSLTWKLAYKLSRGIAFHIKYKLSYDVIMHYEHINTWREIRMLLNYFFADVQKRFLGITPDVALYHFYACRIPYRSACRRYA